jgi:hypothetical protein
MSDQSKKESEKNRRRGDSIKPKGKELTQKDLEKAAGGSVSSGGDRPTES